MFKNESLCFRRNLLSTHLLKLNPLMDWRPLHPSNNIFNNSEAWSCTREIDRRDIRYLRQGFFRLDSCFLHQAHCLFFDFHLHYWIIGNNQWERPKHHPAAKQGSKFLCQSWRQCEWPCFKVSIKRTVDYPSIMEFGRWGIELSKSF